MQARSNTLAKNASIILRLSCESLRDFIETELAPSIVESNIYNRCPRIGQPRSRGLFSLYRLSKKEKTVRQRIVGGLHYAKAKVILFV